MVSDQNGFSRGPVPGSRWGIRAAKAGYIHPGRPGHLASAVDVVPGDADFRCAVKRSRRQPRVVLAYWAFCRLAATMSHRAMVAFFCEALDA
jgi:hypothetical protein